MCYHMHIPLISFTVGPCSMHARPTPTNNSSHETTTGLTEFSRGCHFGHDKHIYIIYLTVLKLLQRIIIYQRAIYTRQTLDFEPCSVVPPRSLLEVYIGHAYVVKKDQHRKRHLALKGCHKFFWLNSTKRHNTTQQQLHTISKQFSSLIRDSLEYRHQIGKMLTPYRYA
jgi:hypothetical protein